ncbi:MAG: lysylphosphatidylglycerol synthase domain-containing protein, partial [Acidobacteriota bacterium]|nr:lysylphosphatidylglycerol synthase domain-containing protein [Acidobacteriota bacterium]
FLYRLSMGSSLAGTTWISRWLEMARNSLRPFRGQRALLLRAFVVSFVSQILIVVFNIMLAFSILGTDIPWPSFFLLIPIAMLGMAVPINPPGALGTGEAMYVFLLGLVGVGSGGVISLLQRFTTVLWALPGALAFVLPAPSSDRYNDATTEKES